MHDGDDLGPDARLDRAIREALRVEPDQERLTRLEHYWATQSRNQRWRGRAMYALPLVAASVAVAALVVVWNHQQRQVSTQAFRPTAPGEASQAVEPFLSDEVDVVEDTRFAGRPPTIFERSMFVARTSVRVSAPSRSTAMEQMISRLTLQPDAEVQQALESAGLPFSDVEGLLLQRLPRSAGTERDAILRLLAVCGTLRSVPALVRLGSHESARDAVLTTIEEIVGTEGVAQVIGGTTDTVVRRSLMRRLLTAESAPALMTYLSLVQDDETRQEALAIAEEAAKLPIGDLLPLLNHGEQPVRLAVARVLGHVNGPEVTRLLITRITQQPADSTEAWMALLACRGDLAEEFLAYARQRPRLLGHFNSARVRWAQMIP